MKLLKTDVCRFHPLDQFDEGKRSCRRRLAGHNKRRRKTQPEAAAARPFLINEAEGGKNADLLNMLTILSHLQQGLVIDSCHLCLLR